MLELKKDDFDENLEDIMASVEGILNKTGKGFEIDKKDKEENK